MLRLPLEEAISKGFVLRGVSNSTYISFTTCM